MIDRKLGTVPTVNAEVSGFCLDYQPPGAEGLLIDKPGWLAALGDAGLVDVYRSVLVKLDGRMFAPVLEYIEAHGLKVVYTETSESPNWMHGKIVREIYA